MKICGWQIEGFGIFCDYHVADLPRRLVLVHGANEAGKSTLLAFLRGVLFGFPDRRSSEPAYPPLRGGRHGGALLLENTDGVYRVERLGGRRSPLAIVRPDHSEGGEADLQRLLGGADRQLFKSVFAFSLEDLAGMGTLSSDQVRSRIFSAGIAGAGRSAREVIDGLQQEAASILSPRAGRIRELVREAQLLSDQIGAAVQRAAEYRDSLGLEEEASVEVGKLRTELALAEIRVRTATTLIDLWPTESERCEVILSFDGLPPMDSFPANPEERLATALGDARTANQKRQTEDQLLQKLFEQRQAIELDNRLPAIAAAANDRAAECAVYRERSKRIIELAVEMRQHEDRVAEELRNLGPGWTEPRLASFDASLPAAEEVRDWHQRVETAKHDADTAAATLVLLERQVAGIEESLGRILHVLDEQQDTLTEDGVRELAARLAAAVKEIDGLEAGTQNVIYDSRSLERAAEALATARQESARLGTISREAEGRLDKIAINEVLISTQDRVNEVARHIEVERQRLRDIENLEATKRERDEAIERGIRELGDDWTEARAIATQTDFGQLQQIREFAAQLADAHERVVGTERELDHVRRGRSGIEKDLQRLKDQLDVPEPISVDTLEKQSRSLRRLRTRLAELSQIESDCRAGEQIVADSVEEPATMSLAWIHRAPGIGGALAAIFAISASWRLLVHDVAGSLILAVAFLMIAVLAFGLHVISSRVRQSGGNIARSAHRLAEIKQRLADLGCRANGLREMIAEDARFLELSNLPVMDQVEDRQEKWSNDRDARRRWDDQVAGANRLKQELDSWHESEIRRKNDYDNAIQKTEENESLWEKWLATKGLQPDMKPDATRDLLQQVRSLQERIAERNATLERLQFQQNASRAWRTNADTLLAEGNNSAITVNDSGALFEGILDLQRRCVEERTRFRERASLENEIAGWNKKLGNARLDVLRAKDEAVSAVGKAYERIIADWQSAETDRDQKKKQLKSTGGSFESTCRDWETWQANRGLDQRMSPEGMLDFFASVKQGRDEIAQLDKLRADCDLLRASVSGWESQLSSLLQVAGLEPPEGEPDLWIKAARELTQRCTSNADAFREAKRLDGAIAEADLKAKLVRQEHDDSVERLLALFSEAGVSSEEEFRKRLAQYRKREELKQKIAELDTRIMTVLGGGDEAATMRTELSQGRVAEWTTERLQWSADVESLRERHEAAIRRHQDLANSRHQLEEAADIAELELQLQAVRDELDASIRRHRVTSAAAALVTDTLREFERTRQPAVLANASDAFHRVTGGRYPRVVQTEDAEGVIVLDRRSARHTVGELSRGTQEQLYLSMRLGLAREFADRVVPLPLVMDDVLVNFDEMRARRMATELMQFAERQQVLLFTCHAFVRSMLLDLDPTICVIDLPVNDVPGGEAMAIRKEIAGRAETQESVPASNLENSILMALREGVGLSLPDLVERLGTAPEQVRRVLAELRETGLVMMSGQKRGARYTLADIAEK
jgi:uncharacterized protein YhaN